VDGVIASAAPYVRNAARDHLTMKHADEQKAESTEVAASAALVARRSASIRTALVLGAVALACFGGIIIAQLCRAPVIGLGALAFAAIAFPLAAIAGRARA